MRSRDARHFYDLWFLLDEEGSPALAWLRETGQMRALFDDCSRITEQFYGAAVERPDGGFAACSVFDDAAIDVIAKSYDKMLRELAYSGRDCPSLADVVGRVRSYAAEL